MAWAYNTPSGHALTVDNDYLPDAPTRIWAFAIDPKGLPGYVAQKFGDR